MGEWFNKPVIMIASMQSLYFSMTRVGHIDNVSI